MSVTSGFICYIEDSDAVKGAICSLYVNNAWYSDLTSRSIKLDFDIADNVAMRYLAFAVSSNNYEWEVLHIQDKQNNAPATVTIPDTYDGAVKFGIKLYDTPPTVGSVLNVGFDYVITGGIDLSQASSTNIHKIKMECNTSGATIRYTTDGSNPSETSVEYIEEIELEAPATIKARGFKDNLDPSDIATLVIEYEADLEDWTAISDMKFGTDEINAICYGDGKFVAVGTGGKASYSTDGITWTAISDMKFGTDDIEAVCYGDGKYIAVGGINKGSYSTDGINWTAISDLNFGVYSPLCVCYGNDKFVVGGSGAKSSYSADGINWTETAGMEVGFHSIHSICYGDGKFVAGGNDGKASYSTDGINWTSIEDTKIGTDYYIDIICYGDGKFVAGGGAGNNPKASYSTDGINWTAIEDTKFGSATTVHSIAYGGGNFVMVGSNARASYSEDGIDWIKILSLDLDTTPNSPSICYGGGKFVIGGNENIGLYCIV